MYFVSIATCFLLKDYDCAKSDFHKSKQFINLVNCFYPERHRMYLYIIFTVDHCIKNSLWREMRRDTCVHSIPYPAVASSRYVSHHVTVFACLHNHHYSMANSEMFSSNCVKSIKQSLTLIYCSCKWIWGISLCTIKINSFQKCASHLTRPCLKCCFNHLVHLLTVLAVTQTHAKYSKSFIIFFCKWFRTWPMDKLLQSIEPTHIVLKQWTQNYVM